MHQVYAKESFWTCVLKFQETESLSAGLALTGACLLLQNPYIYLVLIFEACATFIGQLSVLCLIALFGAATTAMVRIHRFHFSIILDILITLVKKIPCMT